MVCVKFLGGFHTWTYSRDFRFSIFISVITFRAQNWLNWNEGKKIGKASNYQIETTDVFCFSNSLITKWPHALAYNIQLFFFFLFLMLCFFSFVFPINNAYYWNSLLLLCIMVHAMLFSFKCAWFFCSWWFSFFLFSLFLSFSRFIHEATTFSFYIYIIIVSSSDKNKVVAKYNNNNQYLPAATVVLVFLFEFLVSC